MPVNDAEKCIHCENLATEYLTLDRRWFDDQRHSSCTYCQLLVEIVTQNLQDQEFQSLTLSNSKLEISSNWDLAAVVEISLDRESNDLLSFPISIDFPPPRSDSEKCFRFLQNCLTECQTSHTNCFWPLGPTPLPKRVLSIRKGGTWDTVDKDSLIKLYEGEIIKGSYAALSHCWGKHQPLRTLGSNLGSLMNGIPFSDLSAVFQDAVQVCYRMGIEYLWIDSLCIIQDSKEDWERESAKMCEYYENAVFTISASSSSDGSISFLGEYPELWKPQFFPFVDKNDQEINVVVQRRSRGVDRALSSNKKMIEDGEALLTRAWVFQEGVLSKRIIQYTKSRVFWVCYTRHLSEDGEKGSIGYTTSHLCNKFLSTLGDSCRESDGKETAVPQPPSSLATERGMCSHEHPGEDPQGGEDKAWDLWRTLVELYSSRAITKPMDCLPALSGVASKFQSQLHWKYAAGLWEENLHLGLVWEVERRAIRFTPIEVTHNEYIAPTWSWASTGQRVMFWAFFKDYHSLISIQKCECKIDGLNPFGRVSSSYLLLRGLVFCLSLSHKSLRRSVNGVLTQVTSEPDTNITEDFPLIKSGTTLRRARMGETSVPFANAQVVCILLGERRMRHETSDRTYFAMLLGDSGSDNVFHRLGITEFDDAQVFKNHEEKIIRIE